MYDREQRIDYKENCEFKQAERIERQVESGESAHLVSFRRVEVRLRERESCEKRRGEMTDKEPFITLPQEGHICGEEDCSHSSETRFD